MDEVRGFRNYDRRAASDAAMVVTGESGLVQQQFRAEVDVNTIVRRFGITGSVPGSVGRAMYGDFTGLEDLESVREMFESVNARFMALPPEVRDRFGNDPVQIARYADSVSEDEFTRMFEVAQVPAAQAAIVPPNAAP